VAVTPASVTNMSGDLIPVIFFFFFPEPNSNRMDSEITQSLVT